MIKQLKKEAMKIFMRNQLKNEKIFTDGDSQLKYLFVKNKKSDKLLVVFSGFPAEGKQPSYNYVLKFKNLECNKLYILDDFGNDTRGSYYLGKSKDFFIDRAVFQLIEDIRKSNGIEKRKVITSGSSKGGYAALYYAFKYGYGVSIAGAPQYLLGDYLAPQYHEKILEYISGGTSEEDVKFLNDVLADEIERSEKTPKVFIHVSKNEHHYKDHVVPLVNQLKKLGITYDLNLGEYTNHSEVGNYFASYAINSVKSL